MCTSSYYTKAVPVVCSFPLSACGLYPLTVLAQIDLQLAKQGYRLAAWLNVIFDGDANLP